MPEFVNHNSFQVIMIGPDGSVVKLPSKKRCVLPEFFQRYVDKGYLTRIRVDIQQPQQRPEPKRTHRINQSQKVQKLQAPVPLEQRQPKQFIQSKQDIKQESKNHKMTRIKNLNKKEKSEKVIDKRKIVGRQVNENAKELLGNNLKSFSYPISNGIGIGILSYNRASSLKRLIDSIKKFTDLRRTTVFISDDASTDESTKEYLSELAAEPEFVVIRNEKRLGIAGNTNRLMRCLARFESGILLNDDVEIMTSGWENFYANAFALGGMHHFCYRQPGVYGANAGTPMEIGPHRVTRVDAKPHGAVLAYTNTLFNKIGYFDESFGIYGMEHVDWSIRAGACDIQQSGYYDLQGSDKYYTIHPEPSSVEDRNIHLNNARQKLNDLRPDRGYVAASQSTIVPAMSCVIPCRDAVRSNAIPTIINGLRAQRFPVIELILVEHDTQSRVNKINPIKQILVQSSGRPFNKSKAFNAGVAAATHDLLMLHDADLVLRGDYASAIYQNLQSSEACHLGKTVIYLSQEATHVVNHTGVIDQDASFERVVGYFEGGSLACHKSVYWKIGGFHEDFWGYGVEDCEFYDRLSKNSKWAESRIFDFVHMWHGRTDGWQAQHDNNKALGARISSRPMPERIAQLHAQLIASGYGREIQEVLRG